MDNRHRCSLTLEIVFSVSDESNLLIFVLLFDRSGRQLHSQPVVIQAKDDRVSDVVIISIGVVLAEQNLATRLRAKTTVHEIRTLDESLT